MRNEMTTETFLDQVAHEIEQLQQEVLAWKYAAYDLSRALDIQISFTPKHTTMGHETVHATLAKRTYRQCSETYGMEYKP
jgi:cell division septum initiation protein DivIVA